MSACRICGCTDDDCRQCIEKTGEPCCWVEADLCSACEGTFEQLAQDAERSAAEAGFDIKDAFDQIRAALREGACTQEDAVEAVTAAFTAVNFELPVHQGVQLMTDVANKQRERGRAS